MTLINKGLTLNDFRTRGEIAGRDAAEEMSGKTHRQVKGVHFRRVETAHQVEVITEKKIAVNFRNKIYKKINNTKTGNSETRN